MIKLFLIILALPFLIFGKVIETDRFTDILHHVEEGTLLVSDIDNTLAESVQQLGSAQWGEHLIGELRASGKSEEEALAIESHYWHKVQSHIKVRPVESSIPHVIKLLQNKGIHVIALTARHPREANYTIQQLNSIAIDLNRSSPSETIIDLITHKDQALHKEGILFCSLNNSKSQILLNFLTHIGYKPKRILFIDDKWHHIHDLAAAFHDSEIDFIGFRYSKTDARVKAFDPKISEMQMQALPQMISDEEALEKLNLLFSPCK